MPLNNKTMTSDTPPENNLKPHNLLNTLIAAARAATLEQVRNSLALMVSVAKHTEPGATTTHALLDGFLEGLREQIDKVKAEGAQDEHKH